MASFKRDCCQINTCMNKYLATVRINGNSIRTLVYAESPIHARLLIQYQFGMNSLTGQPVRTEHTDVGYMTLDEVIKANKPLTPQQTRINSLKLQKDSMATRLKIEKNKQKIQKAQQQIQTALNQKP